MRTLFTELATRPGLDLGPRIYADANVPAGTVEFMRRRLRWDVLFVVEHEDLRRAPDRRHYELAREQGRTLVTLDRDYLDDRRFPPELSAGVVVLYAPNEPLLHRVLERLDRELFRRASASPVDLPLRGRKLTVDPAWTGDAE